MTLSGHMTKLEAVNDMLWSIGESPVSTLPSDNSDAGIASSILDRVSREVQLQGWHANTLRNLSVVKNASDQFTVADNTLKVDTVNPRGNRISGSPPPTAHVNVALRRSAADDVWLLWDVENNSETWDDAGPLLVDLVQYLEFAELPPALQIYIWTKAARRFQQGAMGSAALYQFTQADETEARTLAEQEDTETSDVNIIRDNPHVYRIVYRNNPNWGI